MLTTLDHRRYRVPSIKDKLQYTSSAVVDQYDTHSLKHLAGVLNQRLALGAPR